MLLVNREKTIFRYKMFNMDRFVIGIDVGGTKTAYGLLNDEGVLLRSASHASDGEASPETFFDCIAANVEKLAGDVPKESITGVGLGMPSFILYDEGYIVKTSNLVKIRNFPALKYLSEKLSLPVILDNDARAAGLAEHRHGAGRGFDKMLYCPVSTGISSALIIQGKPFRGSYGWAGETGHMIATPGEGVECGCGNRGCFMSWCSGSMIVKHIKQWITAGEKTIMAEMAGGIEKIDSIILEAAYDRGDPLAEKALKQMTHWLGIWFYNLYVSFNVNCFILGGGLVNMGEKLFGPLRRIFDEYNHDEKPVYFKTAECSQHGGVLGAAELIFTESRENLNDVW
ncbi:MAG: ROK family protein [Treponema sp.]|jgi:glucokinase|nr:ROK family protein [Treponema sp.]